MSATMQWIADHILPLLVGGWVISLLLAGFAARAGVRWIRRRRAGTRTGILRLVLALVVFAAGGLGVLFTTSGLAAMGPGLLAQRRMLRAPAPEVAWEHLDGSGTDTLARFRGRVVLVNIWATWCPPCRAEMPDLDRLQRDLAERGLVVLHLSDEDAETIASFVARNPTSATHGRADPLPLPETGRPTTYVIDRDGRVRDVVLGARSYEQFRAMVDRHL